MTQARGSTARVVSAWDHTARLTTFISSRSHPRQTRKRNKKLPCAYFNDLLELSAAYKPLPYIVPQAVRCKKYQRLRPRVVMTAVGAQGPYPTTGVEVKRGTTRPRPSTYRPYRESLAAAFSVGEPVVKTSIMSGDVPCHRNVSLSSRARLANGGEARPDTALPRPQLGENRLEEL